MTSTLSHSSSRSRKEKVKLLISIAAVVFYAIVAVLNVWGLVLVTKDKMTNNVVFQYTDYYTLSKEKNEGGEESAAISETGKDIKREMDRYQAKMKLGEGETPSPPTGDSTRSEE